MAVTLKFQSSGAVPGDGRPVTLRGPSLTIGRGPENDLVLPDPDRMISKTHCVIEDQGGHPVVVDLSTNGTFLNYGKQALGRVPTPLSDGDVLILGPYELVVQVSAEAHWSEPLPPMGEGPVGHGQAGRAPDPYKLIDDAAPGGISSTAFWVRQSPWVRACSASPRTRSTCSPPWARRRGRAHHFWRRAPICRSDRRCATMPPR